MKRICYFILLILLSLIEAKSQSLSVFNIDESSFPVMKAGFFAMDSTGTLIPNLTPADFHITENSVTRQVLSVACSATTTPNSISSVLTLDETSSMGDTNYNLALVGANQWVSLISSIQFECAVTTFRNGNNYIQDFTNDTMLISQCYPPYPIPDTLLNPPPSFTSYKVALNGSLYFAEAGKYKRIVILFTNGLQDTTNIQNIIDEAILNGLTIYTVVIGNTANGRLRALALNTGGNYYESITTEAGIKNVMFQIFMNSTGSQPCILSWQSEKVCNQTTFTTNVEVLKNSTSSSFVYSSPVGSLIQLQFNDGTDYIIYSKNVLPGQKKDTIITLKAINNDYVVTNITSSNSAFTIKPTSFTLKSGDSIKLTITFTPVDSNYTYTTFEFISTLCTVDFYAYGGYTGKKSTIPPLFVTFPNGNQAFIAGCDTIITWSGIPSSNKVKLEYSLNKGATWNFITDTATNFKYNWKHLPNTQSNQCLIKASQLKQSNTETFSILSTLNTGLTNAIYRSSWSTDGIKIATIATVKYAYIWNAETGSKLLTLTGHTGLIKDICWSYDGRYIATASNDYTAKIWNPLSGAVIKTLTGHTSSLNAIKWSPDNTKVATCSYDNSAKIWDVTTGKVLFTLTGHKYNVNDVVWNRDGSLLATTSNDSTVKIWNVSKGTLLFTFPGVTYNISPDWNPKSDLIVIPSSNNTAKIFNAKTGALVQTLIGHLGSVRDAKWSPDGTRIATASFDSIVKIWNATSGVMLHNRFGHTAGVNKVQWSPDGGYLAGSSNDKTIIIWDSSSTSFARVLSGHTASVNNLTWNVDGTYLASSSLDGNVKTWHISNLIIQDDVSDSTWSIFKPVISAIDIDMGKVPAGLKKDSIITTFIKNKSFYPCRIDAIYFTGINKSNFHVISNLPFIIPKNSSYPVTFEFAPTSDIIGTFEAKIVIVSQADTLIQNIKGEGVLPSVSVLVPIINFGKVKIGSHKDTLNVQTIQNISIKSLKFDKTLYVNNDDSAFSVFAGNAPFTLNADSIDKMNIRFTPKKVGRTNAYLYVYFEDLGSPSVIQLYGEGILNKPVIKTEQINFKTIKCENLKDTVIHISNTGVDTLIISDMSFTGADSTDFVFLDLISLPIKVAPDSSIKYNIRFLPKGLGARSANLKILSNAVPDSILTLRMYGEKDSISVTTNTNEINFGITKYNKYVYTYFTIFNTGNIVADIYLTVSDTIKLNKYHIKIPANSKDSVMVYFVGSAVDLNLDKILTLTESTCNKTVDIHVKVIVKGENVTYPIIQANGINFPSITCSNFEDSIITISNIGDDTLSISQINLKGTNFNDFKILDVLTYPIEIYPNSSKNISIKFCPIESGLKNAYLEIISNSYSDSLLNINISGQKDSINIMANVNKIDLGVLCPSTSKDTVINIINYGTIKTGVRLTSSSNISLSPNAFDLDSNSSKEIKITYNGSTNNTINENLTYSDSICSNSYIINVIGTISTPEIKSNNLSLSAIVGKSILDSVIIKNTGLGDVLLSKQTTVDLPFKIINNLFPMTIKANDSIKIYFEFIPTDTLTHTLNIKLTGEPCSISDSIILTGKGITAFAILQANNASGYPGETIEVPIKAKNLKNISAVGVTGFNVDLSYNPTLLLSVDETQTIQNDGTAKITLKNLQISNIKNDIITNVKFNVGLGNAPTSDLVLSNAEAIGGTATIETEKGLFTLSESYTQGGTKYINPNAQVQLNVVSSIPAGSSFKLHYTLIENGNTKLYIVNTLGMLVKSLLDGDCVAGSYTKEILTGEFASGAYLIVLETPTTSKSLNIVIIK